MSTVRRKGEKNRERSAAAELKKSGTSPVNLEIVIFARIIADFFHRIEVVEKIGTGITG
jgi:hypothetical protein